MNKPTSRARNVTFALVIILSCGAFALSTPPDNDAFPDHLENQEFWNIVVEFSEPGGYFRSDNLVSNEGGFLKIIPELVRRTQSGEAYLGVGPEQNFSYIAALKPKVAFITDIRRGNLQLHLMYKAIFELSDNRADFVSRLFARKLPEYSRSLSGIDQIFGAIRAEVGNQSWYKQNLKEISSLLIDKHGFKLSQEDISGIESIYRKFYLFGPDITYSSSQSGGPHGNPSYAELMNSQDSPDSQSYLSNEEAFKLVKDLEQRNLIVPVVGDFAGPKTIQSIGKYLRQRNATVSVFYCSNVEGYIDDVWEDFCRNVAGLPLVETSTFIRWTAGGQGGRPMLGSMLDYTRKCVSKP